MHMSDSRTDSRKLIAWCVVAAIGGVCSLVLPPYLTAGGLRQHAYGWPLIPWFALAWANARAGASMLCFLVLGLALGVAQARRWWVVGVAAMALSPVLLSINIVHDWSHDATSHNLFPFEFVMYAIVASPALVGAFLGSRLRARSLDV
jgi:hypothetical protein